jgi:hypothetical protein
VAAAHALTDFFENFLAVGMPDVAFWFQVMFPG